MDAQEFARCFEQFTRSAFRLQTLPQYSVEHEQREFELFIEGEPKPAHENHPWFKQIREITRSGRSLINVHVLPDRLTPYLRYAIDWGYVDLAQAGQDARFLLAPAAAGLADHLTRDFWLFDDRVAVLMQYDGEGRYLGPRLECDESTVNQFRMKKDLVLRDAIDLKYLMALRRRGELI